MTLLLIYTAYVLKTFIYLDMGAPVLKVLYFLVVALFFSCFTLLPFGIYGAKVK
jgi:hypothetical protein